jgi:ADP-ribosylglycohydrolase
MTDVDAFTRVLQANDRAVAYACTHARLLERLLAGDGLDEAVVRVARMLDRRTPMGRELGEHLDAARAATDRDVDSFTAACGRACRLVQAFPAALHAAFVHRDQPADAVGATCSAGGDNASRAMLIGSWLGALHGAAAFPAAWRNRLRAHDEIADTSAALFERRGAAPASAGRRLH